MTRRPGAASPPKRPPASTGLAARPQLPRPLRQARTPRRADRFPCIAGISAGRRCGRRARRRCASTGSSPLIEALRSGAPTGEVFLRLLEWPADDRRTLVELVASNPPSGPLGQWIASLAAAYPTDPGVVGVLLLNYLTCGRGRVCMCGPGQIHAYLQGTGIEILGGSDNVIEVRAYPEARVGRWSWVRC